MFTEKQLQDIFDNPQHEENVRRDWRAYLHLLHAYGPPQARPLIMLIEGTVRGLEMPVDYRIPVDFHGPFFKFMAWLAANEQVALGRGLTQPLPKHINRLGDSYFHATVQAASQLVVLNPQLISDPTIVQALKDVYVVTYTPSASLPGAANPARKSVQ